MQVSVEVLDGLERRLTVVVPAGDVDSEVDKRLSEYARTVRLDGFRPGKVPLKLIRQKFGPAVRQDVVGEKIEKSYFEAVTAEELVPAGMPAIDAKQVDAGVDLEFTATFEVFPEVVIGDLSAVPVDRHSSVVGDEQIDDMLQRLRKQRVEFNAVERAAQEGDQLSLDYEGVLDGEGVEEAKQEGAKVVLGEGRLLPDFESNLAGTEAGQELSFDVGFPDDYPAEKVRGQTLSFSVSVKEVAEPVLPEVDEEFVKSFGQEDGDLESFKADIRENMQRELDDRLRSSNKDAVMEALLGAHQLTLPKALIDEEIERLKKADDSADEQDAAALAEAAERRVKLGLLIRQIVENESMSVDRERLMARLESIAGGYDNPAQIAAMYQNDKNAMQELEGATLEDQVVDWVYGNAQVNEIVKTFDDVMNPSTQQQ